MRVGSGGNENFTTKTAIKTPSLKNINNMRKYLVTEYNEGAQVSP